MPYPPMPETLLLYPFEENESNLEEYKEIFKKVKELLKSVSEEKLAMFNKFQYFLSHLEISYEEYKFAIRSSLKKPQIFLRSQFSDRLLNAYNRNILGLHRVNMATASRSNDRKRPWKCFRQKKIAVFNATEISAQEAAYNILG